MVECIKNICNFINRLMELSLPFKISFLALNIISIIDLILLIIYTSIGCQVFPFPISCSNSIPTNPNHCFNDNYGDFCCGQ